MIPQRYLMNRPGSMQFGKINNGIMKNILYHFCIFLLGLIFNINALDAQTIYWSNQVGSDLGDYGNSGACDNEGNFYFAGVFEGFLCYFQTDTLVRQGIDDLFLVKYDPSGNELWVHRIGGENGFSEENINVYYDNVSNCLFIAGRFSGTVSFGSCTLTANGGLDIFLAKYDLNGNCIWGKKAGGYGDDDPDGIAFDKDGNIYMCGTASLSANFDGFIIPKGGFLAKFDTDGNCIWAKNKIAWIPTFNSQIQIGGLKVFNSYIFLGGCTQVNAPITIDTLVISHSGLYSSLICCFDSTGTAKWIQEGISIASETVSNIAIDSNGNIFQTGYFVDTINFSGNFLISNPAQQEMFLVKYDKNGQFRWARQTSGRSYAEGHNLTNTRDGNIVAVGHFSGLIHFDNFQVQSLSGEDMFMAGYDSLGNCLGVSNYGHGRGSGICEDTDGNLYFTFLFNSNTTLGSISYTSYGGTDILLAKCSAITGIGEPKNILQNQLLIYANPTTGKCTITIPAEFLNEKHLTLQVFDVLGRMVQQAPADKAGGTISLDLGSRPKGIYHAILGSERRSYSGKIVLE
jgi:hypothetical protein